MTLNASGPISLAGTTPGQSIELELGGNGTATISLLDTSVRTLAGVPSGPITMPTNFYGKASGPFPVPITSNQLNANLRTLALAAGWDGISAATVTINAGVYIWSNNTGIPALTIDGSWPGGVTLINNGYIIGMGGAGGTGYWLSPGLVYSNGQPGGPAISLGVNATITNNAGAYIAGGGGGGAGDDSCPKDCNAVEELRKRLTVLIENATKLQKDVKENDETITVQQKTIDNMKKAVQKLVESSNKKK